MNLRRLFFTLVLIALAQSLGSAAQAQVPAGVFVRDSTAGDNLEQVVVDALPKVKGTLAKIFKGKAKSRLRQVIVAAAWQKLTFPKDSVRLETSEFSGARALASPLSGAPVKWTRIWPNGKKELLEVITAREGDAISVRYVAEDGERNDVYRFNPSTSVLTHDITLKSDKLSAPIHYQLVYRR